MLHDAVEVGDQPAAQSPAGPPISGTKPGTPNPGRPHRPAPGVSADGYFRRLYDSEPDFKRLAEHDPQFATV